MTDAFREDLWYSCAIDRYNGDCAFWDARDEAEETTDDPNTSHFVKCSIHDIRAFTVLWKGNKWAKMKQ
jgi:hypothetical protein